MNKAGPDADFRVKQRLQVVVAKRSGRRLAFGVSAGRAADSSDADLKEVVERQPADFVSSEAGLKEGVAVELLERADRDPRIV